MTQSSTLWTEADVIHVYTTEQAVEDGQLIDAQIGDLAEVTRQHVGDQPVFLTSHLYSTIRKAVENKRHCNDWKGVWQCVTEGGQSGLKTTRPETAWVSIASG